MPDEACRDGRAVVVLVVLVVVGVGGTVVLLDDAMVVGISWRTEAAAMTTGAVVGGVVVGTGRGAGTAAGAAGEAVGTEASTPFWDNRSGTTSTAPQRNSPTARRLPR